MTTTLNLTQPAEGAVAWAPAVNANFTNIQTAVNGLPFVPGLYGDGSDGAVTISANTVLARDMFYTTLTVNSGKILDPAGFRVFAKTSVTVTGTIGSDGNAGTSTAGGAGANGGTILGGGGAGGLNANGSGTFSSYGGNGGNAGAHTGGTVTNPSLGFSGSISTFVQLITGTLFAAGNFSFLGGGGGGGAGIAGAGGGGGGGI